jgi:hypothetical protein
MTKTKDKLKLPGFSQGVRVNAAARMVNMAQPICPNSKLKMVKDADGKWVRADNQPQNCQLAEGQWWIDCEARGHDPYFTTSVWYERRDKLEEDEDGNFLVVGEIRIKHEEKRLNVCQVAAHTRVNSGRGVIFKMKNHGFRRLSDFGYEEVCQFRNCQRPITEAGKGKQGYGEFCGQEHLTLAAADAESVMLHYPSSILNAEDVQKIQRARDKQLREVAAIASR